MPFASSRQRRYLHSQEPEVAERFEREEAKAKQDGKTKNRKRKRAPRTARDDKRQRLIQQFLNRSNRNG